MSNLLPKTPATKTFPFMIVALGALLVMGAMTFYALNSIELEKAHPDTRERLAEDFAAKLGEVVSKSCSHPEHNLQDSSCVLVVEKLGVLTLDCSNSRCAMESVVPLDVRATVQP